MGTTLSAGDFRYDITRRADKVILTKAVYTYKPHNFRGIVRVQTMGRADNFKKRFCRACGGRVAYNQLACPFCGHQRFTGPKIRIRNKGWTRRARETRAALRNRKPVPKCTIYRYAQQTGWRPGIADVDSPLAATVCEKEKGEGGDGGLDKFVPP